MKQGKVLVPENKDKGLVKQLDPATKTSIFWSIGAYLVPLILSFFVEGDLASPIVRGAGMLFAGLIAYYWCFDWPDEDAHWLTKVGLMFLFIPALFVLEVPHLILLGWI